MQSSTSNALDEVDLTNDNVITNRFQGDEEIYLSNSETVVLNKSFC